MPINDPKTELLTRDELANMLKISHASVYRLVEQRKIPFFKVMKSLRFDKTDILAYLEKNRVEAIGTKINYGTKNQ